MTITNDQVIKMLPRNSSAADWCDALNEMFDKYEINTEERIAAFMAETAYESVDYKVLEENLNYSAQALQRVWPSRFDEETAEQYARNPEMIANKVYANRLGNGDEASGDGWKYRGRGIIQLTGKANYENFANSVGKTLDEVVDYLSTKEGALESACWFWTQNNLNCYADEEDITMITKRINGGTLGLNERHQYYDRNKAILLG